jgi:hypothetical protein
MPKIPRMVPSRRCFARIDRFESECPHCGRLIFAGIDMRFLPKRLAEQMRGRSEAAKAKARASARPRATSILRLFWNPHSQRLVCPWCEHVYTVGVVIYPVQQRGRGIFDPAPDTAPTPAEVAEMRRLAGGWVAKRVQRRGDHANQFVTAPCRCPEQETDPACPLHGREALGRAAAGTSEGGESEKPRER